MGSGNELPDRKTGAQGINDLLGDADKLRLSLYNRSLDGMPKGIMDILRSQGEGQIRSNLNEGNQALNEAISGAGGGVPISALIKGRTNLQNSSNKAINSLNQNLSVQNEDYKSRGLSDLLSLYEAGNKEAGQANQYNLTKYQADQESRGAKGAGIGELIKTGASIGFAPATGGASLAGQAL